MLSYFLYTFQITLKWYKRTLHVNVLYHGIKKSKKMFYIFSDGMELLISELCVRTRENNQFSECLVFLQNQAKVFIYPIFLCISYVNCSIKLFEYYIYLVVPIF